MSERADRFTAVIDTDVLVGALTRNVLLTFARSGFFRARWSGTTVGQEFVRAFGRMYPGQEDVGRAQLARIAAAFPEARTEDQPRLIGTLTLPDPDDRHVLAAAIQTKAAVIVTNNLRDFPSDLLDPFEVEARSADEFVADCIDLYGPEAVAAVRTMRERLNSPALDADALLLRLEEVGLAQAAVLLAPFRAFL